MATTDINQRKPEMKFRFAWAVAALIALGGAAYAADCCIGNEPCCDVPMPCCD